MHKMENLKLTCKTSNQKKTNGNAFGVKFEFS